MDRSLGLRIEGAGKDLSSSLSSEVLEIGLEGFCLAGFGFLEVFDETLSALRTFEYFFNVPGFSECFVCLAGDGLSWTFFTKIRLGGVLSRLENWTWTAGVIFFPLIEASFVFLLFFWLGGKIRLLGGFPMQMRLGVGWVWKTSFIF